VFAAPVDQPRVRRGTDVVLLALLAFSEATLSLNRDLSWPRA